MSTLEQEILEYAEKLRVELQVLHPRWNGKGLWADLNITSTAEDLEEDQREMWKSFPRDDI